MDNLGFEFDKEKYNIQRVPVSYIYFGVFAILIMMISIFVNTRRRNMGQNRLRRYYMV
jgi:hypothetical protein